MHDAMTLKEGKRILYKHSMSLFVMVTLSQFCIRNVLLQPLRQLVLICAELLTIYIIKLRSALRAGGKFKEHVSSRHILVDEICYKIKAFYISKERILIDRVFFSFQRKLWLFKINPSSIFHPNPSSIFNFNLSNIEYQWKSRISNDR